MIFSREYMQVLVDKVSSANKRVIDIIDLSGYIIASSSKDRINQIDSALVKMLKNTGYSDYICRETGISGVSVPIEFSGQIIGGLFISGHWDDNREIVSSILMSIDVSIQYETLRGQSIVECRNEEYFVGDLLSRKADTGYSDLTEWGNRLGYDMHLPRIVLLIELLPKKTQHFNINLGYDNSVESMRLVIRNEVRNNKYLNNQDIVSFYKDNCLVVIKSFFDVNDQEKKYKAFDKICNDIYNDISENNLFQISLAYGRFAEKIENIGLSYLDARDIIDLAKKLKKPPAMFSVYDFIYEDIVYNLHENILDQCVSPIVSRIREAEDKMKIDICETAECYFESNANVSETAKKLYLHRNSVLLRLDKIRKVTGLDIMNSISHLFLLKLAVTYIRINNM